jgi:hypothetical protein
MNPIQWETFYTQKEEVFQEKREKYFYFLKEVIKEEIE